LSATDSTIIAGKRADTMAEVTFFIQFSALPRSAPPEDNLQQGLGRIQCVLRALENSNDALACDKRAAIVHSRCQLPQTKLSKNRPAKACRPVGRAAFAGCLNGQGPSSVSCSRHAARALRLLRHTESACYSFELGLWPLLTSNVRLRLTHGEGGNYTEVTQPCKGAAKDSLR
jgi:hypothetical protein